MKDTTAFVLTALVAGAAWCLHRLITTWGEVRQARAETDNIRARAETDNLRARAELERSARPPAQRAPAGDEPQGLSPMSNVRVRKD